MNEPDQGDVALFLVTLIGSQLRAAGLLNVDLMQEAANMMLLRPITEKQKATIRMALPAIHGLLGKRPQH